MLPVRSRASDRADGARWRRCVRRPPLVLQGRQVMYPALDIDAPGYPPPRPRLRAHPSQPNTSQPNRASRTRASASVVSGRPDRRSIRPPSWSPAPARPSRPGPGGRSGPIGPPAGCRAAGRPRATTGRSMCSAWASPSSRAYVGGRSSRESSAGRRKVPSRPGSQASRSAASGDGRPDVLLAGVAERRQHRPSPPPRPRAGGSGASRTFQTYSERAWPGWRSAKSRPSISASGSKPSRPRSFRPKSTVMTTYPSGFGVLARTSTACRTPIPRSWTSHGP